MAVKQPDQQHQREDGLGRQEERQQAPLRRREEKSALDDTQETGDSSRVVLVIVALALGFIAIITYFVSQMPRNP
jgi:hypothetical protein